MIGPCNNLNKHFGRKYPKKKQNKCKLKTHHEGGVYVVTFDKKISPTEKSVSFFLCSIFFSKFLLTSTIISTLENNLLMSESERIDLVRIGFKIFFFVYFFCFWLFLFWQSKSKVFYINEDFQIVNVIFLGLKQFV